MEEFVRRLVRQIWSDAKKRPGWIAILLGLVYALILGSLEHRFYSQFNEWQDRHLGELMEWIKSVVFSPWILFVVVICWIAIKAFVETRTRGQNKPPDLITVERGEFLKVIDEVVDDSKKAGAQAGILWLLAAQAKDAIHLLEKTWHHWNNSGERLIHPLDARIDKPDFTKGDLISERRDFMAIYLSHLMRLSTDIPGFTSDVTSYGFPSDREYLEVLNALRSHAEKLDSEADKIWQSESPNDSLFGVPLKQP